MAKHIDDSLEMRSCHVWWPWPFVAKFIFYAEQPQFLAQISSCPRTRPLQLWCFHVIGTCQLVIGLTTQDSFLGCNNVHKTSWQLKLNICSPYISPRRLIMQFAALWIWENFWETCLAQKISIDYTIKRFSEKFVY